MYQIKIENSVDTTKEYTVAAGEQQVDRNSQPLERESYDDVTGEPILDVDGNPVIEPVMNETGEDLVLEIDKSVEEIAAEEQVLKDEKAAEVQAKMDAYMAAQAHQLANGGPGPVGDFEVMKICNEHNCEFEVIFREE
jgi:hypothetical protein